MAKASRDPRKRDLDDEIVDESSPRSDQNVADEIGDEVGLSYGDGEPLHTTEKVSSRDERRWELDPASTEDFPERSRHDELDEPGA